MHEELYARITALTSRLAREGYEGRAGEVAALIVECREKLKEARGYGAWETQLLERAETAQRSTMLRLALNLAQRALDVTQLPENEYRAGYSYTRKYAPREERED